MENSQRYFYITYPVPIDELENIPNLPFRYTDEKPAENPFPPYPKGFMPEWFQNAGFPEDEI